jgi:predicted Zn-dependent protease
MSASLKARVCLFGLGTRTRGAHTVTRKLARDITFCAIAVALLMSPLVQAQASDAPQNYHWARKELQFTVMAGDNVDGQWNDLLREAVSNWDKSDTVTIKQVAGGTNAQECRPTDGRIEVCSWRYGTQEGWLYFDQAGDHIDSVTVQFNDSFFDQSNGQYNTVTARQHTVCHEMGHSIGLDHVDTNSCMNDSQNAVFNNLTPNNKDYQQLASIYNHKDSTTTVDGPQKKDKKKDKKKKKHKKRQDETSKEGGFFSPTSLPSVPSGLAGSETVTVQTLDNGQKVVSYITWAQ